MEERKQRWKEGKERRLVEEGNEEKVERKKKWKGKGCKKDG